jgi:hypothetical protein
MVRFLERPHHLRSRDHVVQPLLALRKADHNVADQQNHSGQDFGKVAGRGASERYALAILVSHLQPERHLPDRGLFGRTLQDGFVEPTSAHEEYPCNNAPDQVHSDFWHAHLTAGKPDAHAENPEHRKDHDPDQDRVDNRRDHSNPETAVADRWS